MLHLFTSKWDGMRPHPAFFTHWFIVCVNPTQAQKAGVCVCVCARVGGRVGRESGPGGTCYYNLSSIRLHGSQWDSCSRFPEVWQVPTRRTQVTPAVNTQRSPDVEKAGDVHMSTYYCEAKVMMASKSTFCLQKVV